MSEQVIVASKIKATVKELDLRVSADAVDVINERVISLVEDAAARAKANNRATLRGCDF